VGIASARGAARGFLRLVEIGPVEIVLSRQVNIEADRIITSKLADCLDDFWAYLETLPSYFWTTRLPGQ
jgi:hypothetical protein